MSNIIVSLKSGKVSGMKLESQFSGVEYYAFYGIPYGQAPIGDLRFKDPVKVKPWKSIRDGSIEKDGCAQISLYTFRYQGSEDCLYVNVYTPKLFCDNEPLKPVIVNIPPGGLQCGSPDPSHQGSPDFMIHNDVVYVTISHRLHILGFLNLNMEDCPGNMGLRDMIMAFEWVQENIKLFGGDPNNVTALGSSSGAVMIHTLLILPSVKDLNLFHKAVLMGDYVFNNVTIIQEENQTTGFEFARTIGFRGDNPKQLLNFLKKTPINTLIMRLRMFQEYIDKKKARILPSSRFLPTMDSSSKNPLVPTHARKFIPSMKKIPIIFGQVEKETIIGFSKTYAKTTIDEFKTIGRYNCWGWMHNLSDNEIDIIHEKIHSFYLGDLGTKPPLTVQIDILDDTAFSEIYDTLIDPIADALPESTYCYKFQYKGEVATVTDMFEKLHLLDEPVEGTFHSDDYSYWSRMRNPRSDKTKQMIGTFTKLITNFAKTGNPNDDTFTEWKPTSSKNPCYLSINTNPTLITGRLNGERYEFWQNLKNQFRPVTP